MNRTTTTTTMRRQEPGLERAEWRARLARLHPTQVALYQAIRSYSAGHAERSPSLRELRALVGATSDTVVRYHVCRLERAGLISRVPRQARSIRLVPVLPAGGGAGASRSA